MTSIHLFRDGVDMGKVAVSVDASSLSNGADWTGEVRPLDAAVKIGLILNPIGHEGTIYSFELGDPTTGFRHQILLVSTDDEHNTGQVQGVGLPPSP
jgi:hypothetical protein